MKFTQLPLGARFEYEGQVYVKTSPVAASGERGGQKLITRYAVLRPLDAAPKPAPRPARSLDEQQVVAAFEAFAADCARLLDQAATDATQHRLLRTELDAARQRFLDALA
ncbi:MAG: hypothetical protein HXY26_00010 [Hydrogenophilaceae bacterium]|nr:hypothetical protein [Hydrogenophilaceae bacterium]